MLDMKYFVLNDMKKIIRAIKKDPLLKIKESKKEIDEQVNVTNYRNSAQGLRKQLIFLRAR